MADRAVERIDVREELAGARVRPFHWVLVALVAAATIFDGFDTFIPSYMIHFVVKPWGLSEAQTGLLVSSGLIGFGIGSLVHGVVADRIGRRPTLLAGLFVAGVFSLLTAVFARSFGPFVLLRVATGLGLGVLLPLGTAYINEYLPRRVHNRMAVLGGCGFGVGGLLAAVAGVAFTPALGWEVLFYIGAGSAVLGLLYLAVFPESVEYLVARGRTGTAAALLARLRPDRAEAYRAAVLTVPPHEGLRDWRLTISPAYRPRTLALWSTAFLLLFCVYGLSTWTPELMIARGHGFAAGYAYGGILQLMSVAGAIIGGVVADRWLGGRRTIMLWCAIGALGALLVAVVGTSATDILGIAMAGLFILGGQFVVNNICARTYPVHARGTGEGLMLGFGRLGGILGPYIGGALLGVFSGTSVLFYAVTVASAAAVATASFTVARRGRTGAGSPAGEVRTA
ncbi:MAG TPA: MFS transporter [Streptosporangiaceae bacterium]|jgi:AAHS family 4-hydroxybenzoate transporter-like MFS transporter